MEFPQNFGKRSPWDAFDEAIGVHLTNRAVKEGQWQHQVMDDIDFRRTCRRIDMQVTRSERGAGGKLYLERITSDLSPLGRIIFGDQLAGISSSRFQRSPSSSSISASKR
jgi:hypothetical protein